MCDIIGMVQPHTDSERDSALGGQAVGSAVCVMRGRVRQFWECAQCGKLLGEVEGGWLFVRHGRVRMLTALPACRRCERCGTWNALTVGASSPSPPQGRGRGGGTRPAPSSPSDERLKIGDTGHGTTGTTVEADA